MENLKNKFIDWLQSQCKIVIQGNVVLVYQKIDEKFAEKIPKEFSELNLEIHYPEIILTENGNYFPGTSKYDSEKEFFTIKISN